MARHEIDREMLDARNVLIGRRALLERSFGLAVAGSAFGVIGALNASSVDVGAQANSQASIGPGSTPNGIRRIVTGNNAQGKSYVVSDTRITGGRAPNVFQTTPDAPLGPGGQGDRQDFLPSTMTQLDPPFGACSSNYVYMPAATDARPPTWHRTMTIDYNFLVSGELVCMLEEGEVVLSGPGDVVVQRNTNHAWRNNSKVNPVIFVAVLVPIRGKA
jgi:hypothetical protein